MGGASAHRPSRATSGPLHSRVCRHRGGHERYFVLTAADVGTTVKVRVTAGNGYGDTTADSGPVGPVAGLPTTRATDDLGHVLSRTDVDRQSAAAFVGRRSGAAHRQGLPVDPLQPGLRGIVGASQRHLRPHRSRCRRDDQGSDHGGQRLWRRHRRELAHRADHRPAHHGHRPTIDITAPVRGQTLVGSSGLWAAWPQPALVHQWNRCTVSGTGTTCSPGGTFSTGGVSARRRPSRIPPATSSRTPTWGRA